MAILYINNLNSKIMKKLLFVALLALGSINANAVRFQTTCGYVGTTVSPDFLETQQEFLDYMVELNETFCGVSEPAIYW